MNSLFFKSSFGRWIAPAVLAAATVCGTLGFASVASAEERGRGEGRAESGFVRGDRDGRAFGDRDGRAFGDRDGRAFRGGHGPVVRHDRDDRGWGRGGRGERGERGARR